MSYILAITFSTIVAGSAPEIKVEKLDLPDLDTCKAINVHLKNVYLRDNWRTVYDKADGEIVVLTNSGLKRQAYSQCVKKEQQ